MRLTQTDAADGFAVFVTAAEMSPINTLAKYTAFVDTDLVPHMPLALAEARSLSLFEKAFWDAEIEKLVEFFDANCDQRTEATAPNLRPPPESRRSEQRNCTPGDLVTDLLDHL